MSEDKFVTVSLILSVLFACVSIVVYVAAGFESMFLPICLTLTTFFFIMALFSSLDFGENFEVVDNEIRK